MPDINESMAKIEAHERECTIRYENIERRLEDGSKKFDRLETMLWAVYPFIVSAIVLVEFVRTIKIDLAETWIVMRSKWISTNLWI